jgi:hypothetical protein
MRAAVVNLFAAFDCEYRFTRLHQSVPMSGCCISE